MVAGCWRCWFTFSGGSLGEGGLYFCTPTQQRGPGLLRPDPLWLVSVVCFTSLAYLSWKLAEMEEPSWVDIVTL